MTVHVSFRLSDIIEGALLGYLGAEGVIKLIGDISAHMSAVIFGF